MNALTELEQRADTEARHAHRELVERLDATLAEALECNEEFSMDNKYLKKRAEAAEAKLAKAVDVIDWALICWDDHNTHGYMMQGDWVLDARTTLAELKRSER
jgi:hypothetical protein